MKKILSIAILALLIAGQVITSEGGVAIVKMMRGKVHYELDGKTYKIKKGTWVKKGAKVVTGGKSFVKLVFIDKSTVNVGPKSAMVIQEFSRKKAGLLNLLKGKIRSKVTKDYLEMAKGQKSKLYVKSPTAVMGIRGTDFMFSYSEKTKTSAAVLFEGNVSFSKLKHGERAAYRNLEKFVDRDNIRIRPGEFSVASGGSKHATIPAVLNVQQKEVLEKNDTFSNRLPASGVETSEAKSKSIVPPGLSGKLVANNSGELQNEVKAMVKEETGRAPASAAPAAIAPPPAVNAAPSSAEGFITNDGHVKPANGSFLHTESGSIISPPSDSSFDPNTNAYIPSDSAGSIGATGEYVPPENIKYMDETGQFIREGTDGAQLVVNEQPTYMTDTIAKEQMIEGGEIDPVMAVNLQEGPNQPPPPGEGDYDTNLGDYSNDANYDANNQTNVNNVTRSKVGFDFTIQ